MALEHGQTLLSYDDYAAIDDGQRYQVLEGELVLTPSPASRHQRLSRRLFRALDGHVEANRLGEVFYAPFDVVLQAARPATVLQPDLLFISRPQADIVGRANVQGPPALVVEILSPSNARLDSIRKLRLYEKFGVPEYWIVGHEFDRVDVMRLGTDGKYARAAVLEPGDTLTTPQLPGFSLPVAELFEGLDEP